MKKITIAIIALAVLGIGVIFAFAQKTDGDHKGRGFGRGGHHRGGGFMFRGLDLTEEQKAQVKQIRDASKTKIQPIREALKANRQKMNELTANGAFDEGQVAALANEQATLGAQMTVERLRVKSQMFALLTDEQKAKAAQMKEQMKERFKNRMNKRKAAEKAPAETTN
jgi:protein CpxP